MVRPRILTGTMEGCIMHPEARPCFTISEAADYLRISRALLYRLVRQGDIRTTKIGKRTIVRGGELERFLDCQQAA
jgi:excisionase family DNA binding protein